MTRPILLALAALIVAGWVRRRKRTGGVVKPAPTDDYDEPVPMTWEPGAFTHWRCGDCTEYVPWGFSHSCGTRAWDGTATYNPNSHTVRIRWARTITEV
jgi:hypothetical protein